MDIKDCAVKYLENRDRTVSEVEQHLVKKGYSDLDIESCLELLLELKYLDDIEYCKKYYDYSSSKGRGIIRIKHELKNKGISDFNIEDAFAEVPPEAERDKAYKEAKKIADGKVIDNKLLSKIGNRLKVLGYHGDLIYEIIGKYMREEF